MEGNETGAQKAAGDRQSGFACAGCEVTGIKELEWPPRPLQSRAEWIRAGASDSQGLALQLWPNGGL